MFGNPVRVVFRIENLNGTLPPELTEKMGLLEDQDAILDYEGIEFLPYPETLDLTHTRREERKFYVLANLGDRLPDPLNELRCSARIEWSAAGVVAGLEAHWPQADAADYHRPPDFNLGARIECDTWEGLQKVCQILDRVHGEICGVEVSEDAAVPPEESDHRKHSIDLGAMDRALGDNGPSDEQDDEAEESPAAHLP